MSTAVVLGCLRLFPSVAAVSLQFCVHCFLPRLPYFTEMVEYIQLSLNVEDSSDTLCCRRLLMAYLQPFQRRQRLHHRQEHGKWLISSS
uniref:Ubs_24 putative toxin n=1 Tax=Unedogemmula bisaya TaxID=746885 RepID=A0A098LWI5_UNEBI